MTSNLVIALDGPAGAGKSTVAKLLAARLGVPYIDTGAMYRALTLKALRVGIALDDPRALGDLAEDCRIGFVPDSQGQRVLMDGEDVTEEIRSPEVNNGVSLVAAVPAVRECLVDLQRAMVHSQGAVMDGRDIGTVVLPNADFKFYIDAPPEVRAHRRWLELTSKGFDVSQEDVLRDQLVRDAIDAGRETAPLRPAEDAVLVDTGSISVEGVTEEILRLCGVAPER